MRRYLPTIVLIVILLTVGGLAIARALGEEPIGRGPYVPTLSDDPVQAQTQALIFVGALAAIIFSTIGLGIVLAITFNRFTHMLRASPTATIGEEATGRSTGPKAPAKSQELEIPLNDDRSAAIFWAVVVLIVLAFQVLRYWDEPLGYLPSISDMLNMPLFRLPGQHIEGLPPFIAGPGDNVTALHILLLVLGAAVVTTIVVGLGLARGFAQLDETVRSADRLKPTLPDRLIPVVEGRIERLRQPRPRRLPGNPIDSFLVALNVLLLVVIAGIVGFYVVPSYSLVAQVDQAFEATQIAGLATATPVGQAGPTGPEAIQAEFEALPEGDAAAGEELFTVQGCVACHSLQPDVTIVGPSMAGIASRASERVPELSAEAYLYQSIVNPNAYIVADFQAGLMPQNFRQVLSEEQLANLIAYLLTLE